MYVCYQQAEFALCVYIVVSVLRVDHSIHVDRACLQTLWSCGAVVWWYQSPLNKHVHTR